MQMIRDNEVWYLLSKNNLLEKIIYTHYPANTYITRVILLQWTKCLGIFDRV